MFLGNSYVMNPKTMSYESSQMRDLMMLYYDSLTSILRYDICPSWMQSYDKWIVTSWCDDMNEVYELYSLNVMNKSF